MSRWVDSRPPLPAGPGLFVPRLDPEPLPILAVEPSPCSQACPAGINVKSYVSLIAEGRFAEALEVVRERCPLPGICGRICHHPCERACRRTGEPVAIRALKRFVADLELELPETAPPPLTETARLAVIGSGPAGLTAAYDLRRAGYPVTVFEAQAEAGGMLRYGIADYRLPPAVLDFEIGYLERAGVEVETGQRIGGDRALEDLLTEGFSAVLVAVGAQQGRRLGLDGEGECEEIEDALTFLRRVNDGDRTRVDGRVLVIGGGSTAIEAARAARRLGADSVEIVYRRLRAEMPADEEEIEVAAAEGVGFRFLTAPARLVTHDGKLAGLECLEVALGEEDASGRRRPIPLPGSEFQLAADRIFAAVGQQVELDFVPAETADRLSRRGLVAADAESSMTPLRGVFAAGDVVSGPSTVIDAIAAGHRAAEAILDFLEQRPQRESGRPKVPSLPEYEIPSPPPPRAPRRRPPHREILAGEEFAEVELAFGPADAVAEARRCMRCGPCSECRLCASSCGRRHLSLRVGAGGGETILLRAPAGLAAGLGRAGGHTTGWLLGDLTVGGGAIDPDRDLRVELTPARVEIDALHCRGCARCLEVCSFDALRLVDDQAIATTVTVDPALCRGCNLCAGVCPTDAVLASTVAAGWCGTRLQDLASELAARATQAPVVVLACQRRAAAVEASLRREGRLGCDALLAPVRCAGQLPAGRLLEIFRYGAASVVVAGCASGGCRYRYGTHLAAGEVLRAGQALAAIGEKADRIVGDWAVDEDLGLDFQMLGAALGAAGRVPGVTSADPESRQV